MPDSMLLFDGFRCNEGAVQCRFGRFERSAGYQAWSWCGGEEEMCQMDSGLVGSCRSRFKIRDSKLRDEVMVSRSDTGTDTDRSSSEARHCRLRQEGCTDSNVGDMGSHDESPSPPSRHCVHHHTALHAIPPLVHSAASRLWRSRTHARREG